MVFYFTTQDPDYVVYMGKDKYENEDLIKHGWPEDMWFHVSNLSSAHVYLRRKHVDQTLEDIPKGVVDDCMQLTKHNSIQGCKLTSCKIVFTPWSNLRKTADMEVGQVSFRREKLRTIVTVERNREAIKRLEKTREERHPDLAKERLERDQRVAAEEKRRRREEVARQKAEEAERRRIAEERSYDRVMTEENMENVVVTEDMFGDGGDDGGGGDGDAAVDSLDGLDDFL